MSSGASHIATCRGDFPILQKEMNGKPLRYLDSASSAQKPRVVIETMQSLMEEGYANIHRGLYQFSQDMTQRYEDVRTKTSVFLGASSEKEIVFTRNATEAMNLVAQSWGRNNLQKGDEILLTTMEHHANIVPWQLLAKEMELRVSFVPLEEDGSLNLETFEKSLTHHTKIVACAHISNSLGVINPVKEITALAKDFYPDMMVLIDGSQGAVHTKVDVQNIGCDFYAMTGHKLYGPTGIGILYGKYHVLQNMPPYQGGGDMIEQVSARGSTYKEAPARFEAGTPAILEVITFGAALEYLDSLSMDSIESHEKDIASYAKQRLESVSGLNFYGTNDNKIGIFSFTADWGHISDIAMILDQCGVAVRSGHHCCMPLMESLGIEGTLRASLGVYTNNEDIDALIEGLEKARDMLG